jgi:hypothetical protein
MEVFLNPDAWIALNLDFLEIVLELTISFSSLLLLKLPIEQRKRATKIGNFSDVYENSTLFGINSNSNERTMVLH